MPKCADINNDNIVNTNTDDLDKFKKIVCSGLINSKFITAVYDNDYDTIKSLVLACKKFNIKYNFLRVAMRMSKMEIIYYMINLPNNIQIQTNNIVDAININDYKLTEFLLINSNKKCLNQTCLIKAIYV